MAGVFSVLMWNAQRDRGSQTGKTSEWLRFSPCIRGGKIRLILPIKNPQHPLSDIWICLLLLFFFLWTESAPLSKSDTSPQFPCVCACVCVYPRRMKSHSSHWPHYKNSSSIQPSHFPSPPQSLRYVVILSPTSTFPSLSLNVRLKAYASPCNGEAPHTCHPSVIWDQKMSFNHETSLSNIKGSVYMTCVNVAPRYGSRSSPPLLYLVQCLCSPPLPVEWNLPIRVNSTHVWLI